MINVIKAVPFPKLTYNLYITFRSDYTVGFISLADILLVLLYKLIEKSKFYCFNLLVCVIK